MCKRTASDGFGCSDVFPNGVGIKKAHEIMPKNVHVEIRERARLKVYEFLADRFDGSVRYGLRRYFKHRDCPKSIDIDQMSAEVADQAWTVFCENFSFDD